MIAALKWEESRVLAMSFKRAQQLVAYWGTCPPENESLAMLLAAQTTWKPQSATFRETTIEEFRSLASGAGREVRPLRELH